MRDYSYIMQQMEKALADYRRFSLPPIVRMEEDLRRVAGLAFRREMAFTDQVTQAFQKAKVDYAMQIMEAEKNLASSRALLDRLSVPAFPRFAAELLDSRSFLTRYQDAVSRIATAYAPFPPHLRAVAVMPSVNVAESIVRTAQLTARWQDQGRPTEPLSTAIAYAEAEAGSQEAEIVEYADVFDLASLEMEADDELADMPTLNLFDIQRTELIFIATKRPALLQDEQALNALPTVDYFNTAQSVCRLVTLINRQCDARGEEPIFKLTNRLVESLIGLPNLVANSRQLFGEFIDCMNFIVYEGAGKDNLRFGKLISGDDAAPVWAIKHFRNLDLRHDVDHGKPREVAKKHGDVAADYWQLIGVSLPRRRQDFRQAQLKLLKQVEVMLQRISDAIQALPPPGAAAKE